MTPHDLARLSRVLRRRRSTRPELAVAGEHGQTTIEVVGILVLVTAILVAVALAVPTLHSTLASAMHSMLAVMFDGRVV